ncbi:MAG: membrane protein insertase YidC, partial [Gammaproteobacteria bacterium]|nr:membrane protein insertase YidC [Gammaproteobacteria bacterium]
IGLQSALETITAGSEKVFNSKIYIGPKLQDDLETLATGLDLTVDYGFLTVVAKPLFWLLKTYHELTGNWGWAIILLTMSIKLVFYKLSETSYRSMANMRKLQPRMKAMKERHGDDKQAFQKAMMEMYKKEKINPLGGCLPILVQIPVFIALYWVLLESVEMRQAPFILWIQDMSAQDPYYVLPVLMGLTMLLQQKLNPAPIDPVQAKVMMALPFVFTVFFLFFPSGLVLYWVVNNTLSIAQQWVITKRVTEGKDK